MSIRHVIYTQEPGIDGSGITAIEKAQIVTGLARIDPAENAAYAGAVVRNGPDGPTWSRDVVYADWYSNINDAVTAAKAGGTGGIVRVPKNTTIDHSGNDRIPLSSGLTIEGEDPDSSKIITTTAGATLFAVEVKGAVTTRTVIRRLKLDGGNSASYGLDMRGMNRAQVEDMEVARFKSAQIYLGGNYPEYAAGWSNFFDKIRLVLVAGSTGMLMAGIVTPDAPSGGIIGSSTANRGTFKDIVLVGLDQVGTWGVDIYQGDTNVFIGGDIGYGHNGWVFRLGEEAVHNKFLYGNSEDVAKFARIYGSANIFHGWGWTSSAISEIGPTAFQNEFRAQNMGTVNRAAPETDGTIIDSISGRQGMLRDTPDTLLPAPSAHRLREIRYVRSVDKSVDDRVVVCVRKVGGTYIWKEL